MHYTCLREIHSDQLNYSPDISKARISSHGCTKELTSALTVA